MKLNCKVGDLAVVINGENAGRIVKVVLPSKRQANWWLVDVIGSEGVGFDLDGNRAKSNIGHIADKRLRPIRDQPGDDETLAWAGLPHDCGVAA